MEHVGEYEGDERTKGRLLPRRKVQAEPGSAGGVRVGPARTILAGGLGVAAAAMLAVMAIGSVAGAATNGFDAKPSVAPSLMAHATSVAATPTGPSAAIGGTGAQGPSQPAAPGNSPSTGGRGSARQRLEDALARRLTTLAALTRLVENDSSLTTSVRTTLETQLQHETEGIQTIAAAVPAEPQTQLRASAFAMVHDYRVYLVMAPKVRIAQRAARQRAAEARVTGAEPEIAARISAAQSKGRTVSGAVTADEQLVSDAATASSTTGSIDLTTLLDVTPSTYPADGAALGSGRASLSSARADLAAVRSDLRIIRGVLGSAGA
jgi:hypothetical protein